MLNIRETLGTLIKQRALFRGVLMCKYGAHPNVPYKECPFNQRVFFRRFQCTDERERERERELIVRTEKESSFIHGKLHWEQKDNRSTVAPFDSFHSPKTLSSSSSRVLMKRKKRAPFHLM